MIGFTQRKSKFSCVFKTGDSLCIYLFIYFRLGCIFAATWAFSSCGRLGLLFAAEHGPLIVVASLISCRAPIDSRHEGFSSCSTQA